ncbi:hypothetical protein KBZ21_41505, partial [Streptomyces sp. A73]|nr:hypothetical protein [Streptomyces sp. A73]
KQLNAAGLHIKVGGVEPVDINQCGPAYHIQVTERYRPLGTPGYHHRTVGPLEPGDAWFIARHSPARVLAEVDAKRGLLDRY